MLNKCLSRRQFCKAGSLLALTGVYSSLPLAQTLAASPLQEQAETALNHIRRQYDLDLMQYDPKLEKAALYQANRMADADKMSHSVGWFNGFGARVKKAGIRGPAAENIAVGQPDIATVFRMWMDSKGHRMNMLDKEFNAFGLAVVAPRSNPRRKYWALMLGVDQSAY